MKVVILAGGYGTRLAEYTEMIPKPMVTIGNRPIIWHIMNIYAKYGHTDFYIALGYKGEMIKNYFLNYKELNTDFSIDLSSGKIKICSKDNTLNWNVTLVDTGEDTMTGGRLKKISKYVGNETFLMTYGDGLANVNINKLIDFHNSKEKLVSLTSVRPNARFGELEIKDSIVECFEEKPQLHKGWINGGFFVIDPKFIKYIKDDSTVLEREPLEKAVKDKELAAYRHDGFWQCMDNKRDRELLENLAISKNCPW